MLVGLGQRDTLTCAVVLRDEKRLMGLAVVSIFSPGQDWEDVDSGVQSKRQTA